MILILLNQNKPRFSSYILDDKIHTVSLAEHTVLSLNKFTLGYCPQQKLDA